MTDLSKFKVPNRRSALGDPPSMDDASSINLEAPEFMPSALTDINDKATKTFFDARSARRTNRTVQFATRVTPEWDRRIRVLAQREGLMLVEILERALDSYEKQIG